MKYFNSNRSIAICAAIVAVLVAIVIVAERSEAPTQKPTQETLGQTEQVNKQTGTNEEDAVVSPDINTQEFKLSSSNVSCSTTTVNGTTIRNCSGNVRVIPRAQADMDPGLYKINEQTKLLKNGIEQDLNTLQQLAENQTTVRLKLAEGNIDTLAEIRY